MNSDTKIARVNNTLTKIFSANKPLALGCAGGQVFSMLAIYSDDPSLNLTEVYGFSVKIVEKNENKQKGVGDGQFKTSTLAFDELNCLLISRLVIFLENVAPIPANGVSALDPHRSASICRTKIFKK